MKAANSATDENRHFKFFVFMNARNATWNLCESHGNHDVTKRSS
jgi:hypothetical protein